MTSRQEKKLLEAYDRIGRELISLADLETLLSRLLQISREVFGFENAIIRLLDGDGTALVAAASYGYPQDAVQRPIRLGEGVMGKAAREGAPVLVADITALPDYVAGIQEARSELAVPLIARDRVIGVFNVESTRAGAFGQEDVMPLMTMAGLAAVAIENARLYQSLQEAGERYRRLHQFNSRVLQSANLGIYTLDEQLRISSWNRKMEEFSGVEESEALGRSLFSLFPMLEKEGFAERLRTVLRTGKPEQLRLQHRNMRGEQRYQKRRLAPLIEDGRAAGVVVLVEDVTEFKGLLDQIVQSEKLAEVGRLSAGIAHEINNPLAVISYGAQLLSREEGLSDFQREMVERIDGETERLKALTGGLLCFSRASESVRRWTGAAEVVEDVLRLVNYEIARNRHRIIKEFLEAPLICADSNKLKQVLLNLMMNAFQAMGREGELRLGLRPWQDGVELRLRDSGPGIPPALREKIFEPFFTTKAEGQGTGLGLYICRKIVQEHGGELLLESPPEGGCAFLIRLPAGGDAAKPIPGA